MAYLYCSDLVFRAIGCPIGIVRCDNIGTAGWKMKGRINHAGLYIPADHRPQNRVACATGDSAPVTLIDAAFLGIERVYLQNVLTVKLGICGSPGLSAHVVLRKDSPGGQKQGEAARCPFFGWNKAGDGKITFSSNKLIHMHGGGTLRCILVTWPLDAAQLFQLFIAHAVEGGREAGDFIHDF